MSEPITWHDVIGPEKSKPYFKETLAYVADQR
ncbi:uracil-DNA glycosylase, partial [Providencia rettgeri]|nr:uracil-DNA glycosylase [Providencia rettgeri]